MMAPMQLQRATLSLGLLLLASTYVMTAHAARVVLAESSDYPPNAGYEYPNEPKEPDLPPMVPPDYPSYPDAPAASCSSCYETHPKPCGPDNSCCCNAAGKDPLGACGTPSENQRCGVAYEQCGKCYTRNAYPCGKCCCTVNGTDPLGPCGDNKQDQKCDMLDSLSVDCASCGYTRNTKPCGSCCCRDDTGGDPWGACGTKAEGKTCQAPSAVCDTCGYKTHRLPCGGCCCNADGADPVGSCDGPEQGQPCSQPMAYCKSCGYKNNTFPCGSCCCDMDGANPIEACGTNGKRPCKCGTGKNLLGAVAAASSSNTTINPASNSSGQCDIEAVPLGYYQVFDTNIAMAVSSSASGFGAVTEVLVNRGKSALTDGAAVFMIYVSNSPDKKLWDPLHKAIIRDFISGLDQTASYQKFKHYGIKPQLRFAGEAHFYAAGITDKHALPSLAGWESVGTLVAKVINSGQVSVANIPKTIFQISSDKGVLVESSIVSVDGRGCGYHRHIQLPRNSSAVDYSPDAPPDAPMMSPMPPAPPAPPTNSSNVAAGLHIMYSWVPSAETLRGIFKTGCDAKPANIQDFSTGPLQLQAGLPPDINSHLRIVYHEIIESVSDPVPALGLQGGFRSNKKYMENGDLCNTEYGIPQWVQEWDPSCNCMRVHNLKVGKWKFVMQGFWDMSPSPNATFTGQQTGCVFF